MSPELSSTLSLHSGSAAQTEGLGACLGALLGSTDLLLLEGTLGAGKTCLVRGIAAGWGSSDPVSSPTFVLVNAYRRPSGETLYHLDCYRLRGEADAVSAGIADLIEGDSPLLIEWPERIVRLLAEDALRVRIDLLEGDQRLLHFEAQGPRPAALLAAFRSAIPPESG